MTTKTWLYLYENRHERRLYVGIADRLDRVWQQHNADAESVRDSAGTQILQTVQPFSSRDDALKAEAIAIHVAMLSGVAIYHAGEAMSIEGGQVRLSNRAGVASTSVLGPAVKLKVGEVAYDSLAKTAIVTIASEDMDERRGPYGGLDGAVFSERAQKWFTVATAKQARVKRLIAILTGSHGVILGDWDVAVGASYGPNNNIFPLLDPGNDDSRGVKGMRLVGVRGQSNRIYSMDLR